LDELDSEGRLAHANAAHHYELVFKAFLHCCLVVHNVELSFLAVYRSVRGFNLVLELLIVEKQDEKWHNKLFLISQPWPNDRRLPHNQTERRPHTWKKTKKTTETVAQPDNSKKEHEKLKMETLGSFSGGTKQPAADTAGPKACTTCRLAHVACDRFVAPPPK
jgi:hypothetical protein